MSLLWAERPKANRDRGTFELESAYQLSISNTTTAADLLLELNVEMWSADTVMDVDESTSSVGSNSGHPRCGP